MPTTLQSKAQLNTRNCSSVRRIQGGAIAKTRGCKNRPLPSGRSPVALRGVGRPAAEWASGLHRLKIPAGCQSLATVPPAAQVVFMRSDPLQNSRDCTTCNTRSCHVVRCLQHQVIVPDVQKCHGVRCLQNLVSIPHVRQKGVMMSDPFKF